MNETTFAPVFEKFGKIARLNCEIVITEKIDGTNGQICISEAGDIIAGSRNRWLHPDQDNHGFAKWVQANKQELLKLGPGRHFGEWYGQGIQRNYGLKEKRFMLFNVAKWADPNVRPICCEVATELYRGPFTQTAVDYNIAQLKTEGSLHIPGFLKPEGIVIFHTHSGHLYKVTCENDEKLKGEK